jgi:hypothetical protein
VLSANLTKGTVSLPGPGEVFTPLRAERHAGIFWRF